MLAVSVLSRVSRLAISSCQRMPSMERTARMIMKLLQLLNVLAVPCPGLTSIEKRRENSSTVGLELRGESNFVSVEHPSVKPSKCLACFADP